MRNWYSVGAATVENGSTTVTGINTLWYGAGRGPVRAGDEFGAHVPGARVRIASVNPDGTLTLAYPWSGPDQTNAPYEIAIIPDAGRVQETTREFYNLLSGRAFFRWDASGSLADRDLYDDRPRDFAFLDVSTNPATLYVKVSGESGDWSAGLAYATGPVGPPPNFAIGPTTTGEPGTDADVDISGVSPDYTLNFTIPGGTMIEPGTVTTLDPNQPAAADYVPVPGGFRLDLAIPRGPTGDIDGVTPFWVERLSLDDDAQEARDGLDVPSTAEAFDRANHTGVIGSDAIANSFAHSSSPFGRTGFRPLVGDGIGDHCGWGGISPTESGKLIHIYRKATSHAITNGAQVRQRVSHDGGSTWVDDRLLYTEFDNDARPDAPRLMGDNRVGFFVNRSADPSSTRKFPLFFKTDDEGVTWSSQVVETASTAYTFQGHSGLMTWPASRGGHDTFGYMTFGYVAPGGMGALRTANNGDTWSYVTDVAMPGQPLSEILQDAAFNTGTGWVTTTPWSIANGKAVKVAGSGNLYATVANYVSGTEVTVTVNVESISGGTFRFEFFTNGSPSGVTSPAISAPGLHSVKLTIPTGVNRLYLIPSASGVLLSLKHFSVRAQRTDGTAISSVSETCGFQVPSENWWVFISRANAGGWRQMLTIWVTDNPFNWGLPLDAGVDLFGNPPGCLVDEFTGKAHILNIGRGGRGINGFDHHLLHIEVGAADLYKAAGSFTALDKNYEVLIPVPNWATGYVAPFYYKGAWWTTITFGESGTSGGEHGATGLIGDFIPTTAETLELVDFFLRRQIGGRSISLRSDDNLMTSFPFSISDASGTASASFGAYGFAATGAFLIDVGGDLTLDSDGYVKTPAGNKVIVGGDAETSQPAMVTVTIPNAGTTAITTGSIGSNAARTHWAGITLSGTAGTIVCSATTTAYNTTSDENWKKFVGRYDPQKAIDIIRRDPVRDWYWDADHGGGYGIGWGAQTSYEVSPDLATPGGWFDRDGEPCGADADGATYMSWGVDESKRAKYLWAAVTWLLDERDEMLRRLEALERG